MNRDIVIEIFYYSEFLVYLETETCRIYEYSKKIINKKEWEQFTINFYEEISYYIETKLIKNIEI